MFCVEALGEGVSLRGLSQSSVSPLRHRTHTVIFTELFFFFNWSFKKISPVVSSFVYSSLSSFHLLFFVSLLSICPFHLLHRVSFHFHLFFACFLSLLSIIFIPKLSPLCSSNVPPSFFLPNLMMILRPVFQSYLFHPRPTGSSKSRAITSSIFQ